jgi:hypothetical protein
LPTRGGGPVDTGAAGPVARWGDQTEVLFGRVVLSQAMVVIRVREINSVDMRGNLNAVLCAPCSRVAIIAAFL